MLNVPVLFTDRLVLRGPEERDLEQVVAFMASDRAQFVGGPADRWNAYRGFAASIGHWVMRGYGFYTVCRKDSGDAVGRVGIINHDTWPEPELGWQMWENGAGQGFATEAALAVRDHAKNMHGFGPLISLIDPLNTASKRLAQRLGCTPETEIVKFGKPCTIWRHPAEVVA